MTTLQEALAQTWLWSRLVKRHPELAHDPMPSVDEMVVEFLRRHDVFVKPVGSNINASSGANALMGAVGGPMAVGINQALTAQAKGVALQEWTSWKQWALSHSDWPDFKNDIQERYQLVLAELEDRFQDQDVQESIDAIKTENTKKDRNLAYIVIGGIFVGAICLAFFGQNQQQPQMSQPIIEKQGSNYSAAAEACRLQAQKAGIEGGNTYFKEARVDNEKWAKLIFERPDGTTWETDYAC